MVVYIGGEGDDQYLEAIIARLYDDNYIIDKCAADGSCQYLVKAPPE